MRTPMKLAKRLLLSLLLTVLLAACGRENTNPETAAGEHSEVAEPAKGPNGGRLLVDGAFALELAIFETGVPPEFHAWARLDDKPLAPADVPGVLAHVERRVMKLLKRRGLLHETPDGQPPPDTFAEKNPAMAAILQASLFGKNVLSEEASQPPIHAEGPRILAKHTRQELRGAQPVHSPRELADLGAVTHGPGEDDPLSLPAGAGDGSRRTP